MRQLFAISLLLFAATLARAQSPARSGKDYAVFFYVTDFKPGWARLPETAGEAQLLKAELEREYGFICESVPNPTKQLILDKIADYNKRLTAGDQVLFFFSMHGYYDPHSDLGYLVAADGLYNDTYYTTWLDYNSLRPYFARCKAKHILVALDACYSGSFGSRNKSPDGPIYNEDQDCAGKVKAPFKYTGKQYVCSGNKDAKTPAKSLFAAKFLEALRKGPDSDGLLHFDDLAYWLGKVKNPEPENGFFTGHEQAGDFVFVRKNACAIATIPINPGETDALARDLAAWKAARTANTIAAYRQYLLDFKEGEFRSQAQEAKDLLETLEAQRRDDLAWEVAKEKKTKEAYEKYKKDFPGGSYVGEADDAIKALSNIPAPDRFVKIEGGTFQMGDIMGDKEYDNETLHPVTVSTFYLSPYEVTFEEYDRYCEATGKEKSGDEGWGRGKRPAIKVSWYDAVEYCNWRSQQAKLKPVYTINGTNVSADWSANGYRLPTEAEWEYAARAVNGKGGGKVRFGNGKDVADPKEMNFDGINGKEAYSVTGEYRQKTTPVGDFSPNSLGLYDMSGNVWEWCWDWYGTYPTASQTDPKGTDSGSNRVYRGGSWFDLPVYARCASRLYYTPDYRYSVLGFRLARAAR